jgi:hypothetical protein
MRFFNRLFWLALIVILAAGCTGGGQSHDHD